MAKRVQLADVDLRTIMLAAYRRHIAVPAFNIPHLPMVKPIVETLKRLDAFALVEVALLEIRKFEARSLAAAAAEFSKYADRNVTRLHHDHVPVIDEDGQRVDWRACIQAALDLNYDSVMVDGSRLPLEENIAVTRTVAEMAHARGIPAEAELGAVMGHENRKLPSYEELFASGEGFTKVDEAQRFVAETGVDWLSVAIGNFHGAITGAAKDQKKVEARLDIDHLRKLSDVTKVPIVLHGGSGIKRECVLDGIRNGITKINVATTLRQAYSGKLKETASVAAAQEAVAKEMEFQIREYFAIEGSAGVLSEAV